MASATERPQYELLDRFDNIEVRRYKPMIMAITHTSDGDGFNRLAGYIFGGNDDKKKIAMTAPVANRITEDGWETSFMMPSQYRLDQLPSPTEDSVSFVEVPERTVVAIVFSGWANKIAVNKHHKQLEKFLREQGYATTGTPIINQYDSPWTPANERTNEIHFELIEPMVDVSLQHINHVTEHQSVSVN